MATITQTTRFDAGNNRVYTSPVLTTGDNWIVRPWLICETLTRVCGPEIDEASLIFDVGDFSVREQSAHIVDENGDPIEAERIVSPLELNQQYCKIEILDGDGVITKTWFGVIELTEDQLALSSANVPTGRQTMRAFGLMRLLEQRLITYSRILDDNDVPFTINRGLGFNVDPHGAYPVRGNRSATTVNDPAVAHSLTTDSFLFSHEPRGQALWDARSALRYLMNYHSPTNGAGVRAGLWNFFGPPGLFEWYDISVETDRRTVKDVIDEIIDRRRMLGYWVEPVEDADLETVVVRIRAFTFADQVIQLPWRGKTITANPDQKTLDFAGSPLVSSSSIVHTQVHAADRIIVEGDWITSTCTFNYLDFEEGWTSTQETDYRAGDGGGADENANTAARTTDSLSDVFSRFVIDPDWNQIVEKESNGDLYYVTVVYEDPNGILGLPFIINDADVDGLFSTTNNTKGGWWFNGKRFLNRLPLADDNSDEFRRPFVLFQEPDAPTKYRHCDLLSAGADGTRNFNCHLYLLDDALGFRVDVNVPGGQQLIAGQDAWNTAADTPTHLDPDEAANHAVEYDEMLVTAAVEWDERVRWTQIVNPTIAAGAHFRERRIRIADARLDFELPGTITDVDTDGTLIESTGRVLRDDTIRLREIAVAAAQWYGQERNAIAVAFEDVQDVVELGDLITTSDGTTVNTVVTRITYDLAQQSTSLTTSYVEADFT